MAAFLQAVAETVRANHRVGVDNDPVAQNRAVVQDCVGVQDHVGPKPAIAADDGPVAYLAAVADHAAGADAGERKQVDILAELSRLMDDGTRIDTWQRFGGRPAQMLKNDHKS